MDNLHNSYSAVAAWYGQLIYDGRIYSYSVSCSSNRRPIPPYYWQTSSLKQNSTQSKDVVPFSSHRTIELMKANK